MDLRTVRVSVKIPLLRLRKPDAPLGKKLVSEKEKQTIFPTKIESVKQHEKPARKPVKYAEKLMLLRPQHVGFGDLPNLTGHPQKEDQGYVDSGCSRHMTGNLSYLSDFKEFDKGYVTFGGGARGGRITDNLVRVYLQNVLKMTKLVLLALRESNIKPLQNGVAERRNRTLIEAARTMLADSKLPTTFWAEVVYTACYVQNRVIIVKPRNKTPYELFRYRTPALSFMRPFGCHVTILNTLDHLGKFDGKSEDGFFVGYSLTSKAFRVYNIRTRKVEENLHIRFLENKPIVTGDGPKWLFNIDSLTKSMNYVPNGNSKKRISTGKDGIVRILSPVTVAEIQAVEKINSCTPSTSSTNIPEKEVLAGFADEVIYSLFAKQSEDWDLLHEDLEQIDDVDIEEMDINWQIAMIAIRMKKFYKKTGRRVRVDGKTPVAKGTHDGKKKRDSFYQHQEAGKQEKNQMGLLTMDDGIVNWGEHTEAEETNHALMAISSSNEVTLCSKTCIDSYNTLKTLCDEQMNQLGDQEAQILAYSQAVKKLEAQLVTFQKQQLSLNEKLTFQANEIYEKDEKLKRYRRIGMKAVKEKEQLQKTLDSWKDSSKNLWRLIDSGMSSNSKVGLGFEIQSNNEVLSYEEEMNFSVFKCSKEDSIGKPLYSRFTKTNDFKGVPHPLSGDYTPKPQEEIDDSLYVYGKKGPQKPEISVSDDNSSEHSTCQSNDSEGSCGNTSEHSFETESESLSVPNEMSKSRLEITNEKVMSELQEVEPSCAKHVNKDQLEDFEVFNGRNLVTFGSSKGTLSGKDSEEKDESGHSSTNSKTGGRPEEPPKEMKDSSIGPFRRTILRIQAFRRTETGIFDEASFYCEEGAVITELQQFHTDIEAQSERTNHGAHALLNGTLNVCWKLYKDDSGFSHARRTVTVQVTNSMGSCRSTLMNEGGMAPKSYKLRGLCLTTRDLFDPDHLLQSFIRWSKLCIDCIKLLELVYKSTPEQGRNLISQDEYCRDILKKFDLVKFVKLHFTPWRDQISLRTKDEENFLIMCLFMFLGYSKDFSSQCCQEDLQVSQGQTTLGLMTATTNTHANGTLEIKATIDDIRYTITEASIRDSLQLDDATGITMLPNDELFEGVGAK
ncbi:putative ribonuclease H-like domain-containing protein [Tanacetum coccineum]|uniref:Ribonuclease H-like domain-containing protein n=1 Tax=Tanacetum coccineum TaxID=301880 RepID=A0ABQ5HJC3_9ASTR